MEPKELAAAKRIAAAFCAIGVEAVANADVGGQSLRATVSFDEFKFRVSANRKAGSWSLYSETNRYMNSIDIFAPKKGIEEVDLRNVLKHCENWRLLNAEQLQRKAAVDKAKTIIANEDRVHVGVVAHTYSSQLSDCGRISFSVPTLDLPRMTAAVLKLLNSEQKAKDKPT